MRDTSSWSGLAERLVFSFYAAGPLHSLSRDDADFNLYWLSAPPFAPEILGERIKTLHASMARFFGNGVERTITYLPRGAEVNGLIWVKVPTQAITASTIEDHCPA